MNEQEEWKKEFNDWINKQCKDSGTDIFFLDKRIYSLCFISFKDSWDIQQKKIDELKCRTDARVLNGENPPFGSTIDGKLQIAIEALEFYAKLGVTQTITMGPELGEKTTTSYSFPNKAKEALEKINVD